MASGNSLLQWSAEDGTPPTSAFATPVRRNNHVFYAFDAATDENLDFRGILPQHYAGGGLTLKVVFIADSATSGDVVWAASIERKNTDLDSDSLAAAQTATVTTNGTAGIPTTATITFTSGAQMDSLAAGEPFRLRISRDADNGSDTMAGDAQLDSLELRET